MLESVIQLLIYAVTIILFNLIDELGARAEPNSWTLPLDSPTVNVIRSLLPVSSLAYSVKNAEEPLCVTRISPD